MKGAGHWNFLNRAGKMISAVLYQLYDRQGKLDGLEETDQFPRDRINSLLKKLLSKVFSGRGQARALYLRATSSCTLFKASRMCLGTGLAAVTQALVWRSADFFSTCP